MSDPPNSSSPQSGQMPAASPAAPRPQHPLRKWAIIFFKIAIAVLGIWYVCQKVTWEDSATLLRTADMKPPAGEAAFDGLRGVRMPDPVQVEVVSVERRDNKPDIITIRFGNQKVHMEVAGEQIYDVVDENLLTKAGRLGLPNVLPVPPWMLENSNGQYIHQGLHGLLVQASSKWQLVLAAWILLGVPFFVTAIRWRNLMKPQGIDMPLGKCLQLTFVGQFYSIMLPGITGGDLVKIVYAARLTGSKSKSFITIVLDRVIGLVALMVIAGVAAGVALYNLSPDQHELHDRLFNVFVLIVILLAILAVGATVYFSHRLRRLVGIEWFVDHFGAADPEDVRHDKMEHLFRVLNVLILSGALLGIAILAAGLWVLHMRWAEHNQIVVIIGMSALGVGALGAALGLILHTMVVDHMTPVMKKAVGALVQLDETLHVYRGHFGLLGWAFFISLISQLTLPMSAWLSGMALGMTAPLSHFLAYVPVAVLAASMPISPPQGFGIMDWLLVHFFAGDGGASQAFALAQSVRFLPLIWNLFGAYWVVTGSYSRKKEVKAEQQAELAGEVTP